MQCFNEITRNLQPVLRYWFHERFSNACTWLWARQNYIHTTAVSSMVGYIAGIGDRHLSNILLDSSSGEVIHIDFGIVFEQGRLLQFPEVVPFRLTRDIIDGMGETGLEGPFRRSSESTLRQLRHHKKHIVTLAEVLVYDPITKWKVTSTNFQRRQQDENTPPSDSALGSSSSAEAGNLTEIQHGSAEQAEEQLESVRQNELSRVEHENVGALHALRRIEQKLNGKDLDSSVISGNIEELPVEHHVRKLIAASTDPKNLSKMFHGWMPQV